MNDRSSPLDWEEAPTAAANLAILLLPGGNLPAVGNSPSPTPDVLDGPLPADRQAPPATDPQFATCYHAEMPALIAFLINCGANPHDAADAAQEAFLELFKQWHAVEKPKQWLRTVAFRIFLHQPVGNTSPLQAAGDIPSLLSTSTHFDSLEEEKFILDVLNLLPTTQRAVLALHYDQFETCEIAEILGMKQATARKNLERARATLNKLLDFGGEQPQLRLELPQKGQKDEPHE